MDAIVPATVYRACQPIPHRLGGGCLTVVQEGGLSVRDSELLFRQVIHTGGCCV